LISDEAGNFYGVATTGGAYGQGVVFALLSSPNGKLKFKTLYAFKGQPDAGFPYGGLLFDASGNLYVGKSNIHLPLLYNVSPTTSIPDMGFNGNNNISFPWSYFGANPWFQANTTINFNDNLSWVKHNHTFKFGVFYQRSRKDQIAWGNSNGQFSFSNCPTSADPASCPNDSGMAYASALLGDFSTFSQSSTRPIGFFRYNQLELYAQDTWKTTSRLTLDYGIRFVWIPPQYDAKNQVALFNPSLYSSANAVRIYTCSSRDSNGNCISVLISFRIGLR